MRPQKHDVNYNYDDDDEADLLVNLTEGKQAKESSWGDGSRKRGDGEVAGMLKQYFRFLP